MFQFIKTTALGGILFFIPVIILIAIFRQAHDLVIKFAGPLIDAMPVDRVLGIALIDILVLAVVLFICFIGGLAAKTAPARRLVAGLETQFLSHLPAYDVVKIKLTAKLRFEQTGHMPPVLVSFDDQKQIGFEVERLTDGDVLVYLPGSPDAFSGAISIVTPDRIAPIDAHLTSVLGVFKHFGRGANGLLRPTAERP